MTKIKICGLKRLQDIEYVNELLPDYVGFVFAKSKRQVHMEKAEELISKLNTGIKTVGVFVNEDIKKVKEIAENLKLDVLQFHGCEDKEYFLELDRFTLWKSVSIEAEISKDKAVSNYGKVDLINNSEYHSNSKGAFYKYKIDEYQSNLDGINKYNIEAVVLDSSVKGTEGGTGISFDWNVISKLNIEKNLILAGGLNTDNVIEAINKVKPFAVDVSSGVETDGVKDFNKIKTFIEKVRNIK
ncbi:phosphoribosylanthranilate isomerase [Clostridium pasteurianum]|uniref:N-(5'-phosphoribosyl)anthranilate isomerase n=1 Tax=Clostridium pasteurianum BC1 TaxID=86416 RepID=R4KF96_CLOPA|nr:phosphoribosylanthranilate isomerase [Clostridium pasteurianum]AGK98280.1 phosphoribosylanthranilate isomerase [Clostridium pasteurianum BC1]